MLAQPAVSTCNANDTKVGTPATIYERLGGIASVRAAVDIFYEKVLQDTRINRFFMGMDMTAQKRKQVLFLSYVFGGAEQYRGKDLVTAHKRIIEQGGCNRSHWQVVADLLVETLKQMGVPQDIIDEVWERVEPTAQVFPMAPVEQTETAQAAP